MKFQRMLSNGKWTDEDRIDTFVERVLVIEPGIAAYEKRETLTTKEQVLAQMATGKIFRYDTDWYAKVRDLDGSVASKPAPVEMVCCDCGHSVPRNQRMSSSSGTSCPNCYDRMSN
jgi:hypothetical protein